MPPPKTIYRLDNKVLKKGFEVVKEGTSLITSNLSLKATTIFWFIPQCPHRAGIDYGFRNGHALILIK